MGEVFPGQGPLAFGEVRLEAEGLAGTGTDGRKFTEGRMEMEMEMETETETETETQMEMEMKMEMEMEMRPDRQRFGR